MFTWQTPIEYAVLKRGDISIHLSLGRKEETLKAKRTSLYMFVHNIKAAHQELKENGAPISASIESQEYNMTEFYLHDPGGYLITIGQGTS